MIIGGNNNGNRNPLAKSPDFNNKFRNNNANFINNNKPQQPISQNHYKDITNSKEMTERSFDILQQRYKDGLISIEEFSRKCEQLRNRK